MEGWSIAEAAAAVGLSRARVDQLVRAGRIPATRIGNHWVLDNLDALRALPRHPGRPLTSKMAWALLLAGDGVSAEWLARYEHERVRRMLVELAKSSGDDERLNRLASLVRHRAARIGYNAPSIDAVAADKRVLLSGANDPRAGIAPGRTVEGYVHADDLPALAHACMLVQPTASPVNVWLHVTPYLPPEGLPALAVVADLIERGGPRELSQADLLLTRALRNAR